MTILVTRPSPYGEDLVKNLFSLGIFAYHLPFFYFSIGRDLSLLKIQLSSLHEGDFIFLLSQHAVKYANYYLLKLGISWPVQINYYAIGRATSLKMYDVSKILPKFPQDEETSENLLRFPELMYMNKSHVLILKGNNGRFFLEKELKQRGAFVNICQCYYRNFYQYEKDEKFFRMLSSTITVVVVTSEEILKKLYYFIPEDYRVSWLLHCRLIVVSARVAIVAQVFGWKDIIIAHSANNKILTYVIDKYKCF